MKALLLLCTTLIFISCLQEDNENNIVEENLVKESYKDGTIKYQGRVVDSKKEGIHIWYRKDGSIETKVEYKNDKIDGVFINYYKSGKIKEIANFSKDIREGETKYFDEKGTITRKIIYSNNEINSIQKFDKNGRLRQESEYLFVYWLENRPFLNTDIYYDSLGNILNEKSNYYIIENDKKNYLLNESYILKVELIPFFNKNMKIMIAEFDEEFKVIDSLSINYIDCFDFKGEIPLNTSKVGNNVLKFIIHDYKREDFNYTESKDIYVKYEYVVKE